MLERNLQVLRQADKELLAKAIPMMFIRCGAEAGKVKRVLDENELSWGYFTDHNPFEPHCNAHPNNLVVLDPLSNEFANMLGVLDLDLAYSFDTFVNTIEPDPIMFTDEDNLNIQRGKYGTKDREQFDDWINSEKYELELALGGQEAFNFRFGMQRQDSEQNEDVVKVSGLYNALMQDFCVKSYRESYDKVGWLWSASKAQLEAEVTYRQALPLISALVYISILLTKEELI